MLAAGAIADCAGRHRRPVFYRLLSRRGLSSTFRRPTTGNADMDYEVQRCTRHCATSGRELNEGEEFFSALRAEGKEVRRYDYSAEVWAGPPERAFAWWKSHMPTREAKRGQLAPNEVLLALFQELEQTAVNDDMRYVLALLLVRRRVMREEDVEQDAEGRSVLVLYCPRDESTHRVKVATPGERRTAEIQAELSRLLFADAG